MQSTCQETIELRQVKGTGRAGKGLKRRTGCHVTPTRAILLAVAVVAGAILIGLIVYYAFPRSDAECGRESSRKSSDSWEQCQHLAAQRNICLSAAPCRISTSEDTAVLNSTKKRKANIRLPLDVTPIHYNLELIPDIYSPDPDNFTVRGHVAIVVQCSTSTDVITLHMNRLRIEDAITLTAANPSTHAPTVQKWTLDEERQFFIVQLNRMLIENKIYILNISFSGPIKNDLTGLYWSSYTTGGDTRYLATTQMQPTDARKTFPCFDEPALKATYDVTILRRPHMKTLANAEKIRTENRPDDWVADVYNRTLKMSTYLLAFVVCDFEYSESFTRVGTKVRVWSRPEAVEQTFYAVNLGTRTIDFYEQYFGIPFPLRKQDMLAVPDFLIGAMENWGLIIYREQGILFKSDMCSVTDEQWLVELIVHELAHQWFGNLVTPSWWDDLWLNEGFASYMEYIAMAQLYPDWKMDDQFVVRDLHYALQIDSLSNSHPIYVPVYDPEEIGEIFDTISYLKGASVIRMMNQFLGDEIFTSGLSNYLNSYAYGNANHSNLWDYLSDQASKSDLSINVSGIMNTWVRQMGYPVVTMETEGNKIRVRQERFLQDSEQADNQKYVSPYDYKWNIPVTYADENAPGHFWENPRPVWFWWNQSSQILARSSEQASWFVGNVGQYGYYRVNYDIENWRALIEQLNDNHTKIPIKNRAQIIDDAINLGSSGYLDQLIGMGVTEYLDKELDYVPWKSAVDALSYIDNMLRYTKFYGVFKKYMLSKVVPIYEIVGFDYNHRSATHLDKQRRRLICQQACKYGHLPCKNDALSVFRQWMIQPDSTVLKPDQRTTVYCNAVKYGGQKEWDFLYQYYKHTQLAAEAKSILKALACSQDPWILNRYLHYALDNNKVRRQDGLEVIRDVAMNAVGNQLAWNFYRENWPVIRKTFGTGFWRMAGVIEAITATFNSEFQLQQLLDFLTHHSDLGTGLRAFSQAVEVTRHNIKWMNANLDKTGDWLTNRL